MNDENTPFIVPEDQREILFEFLTESEENLDTLNDKMLDVEASIKNNTKISLEDLNAMFRGAHTIKGTASFMGLNKVVSLTHKSETLLQKLRDQEMPLTQEIVDTLFSAFDTLSSLLKCLKETFTEKVDISENVARIEAILNSDATVPSAKQAATDVPKEKKGTERPETTPLNAKPIVEKYLNQFISEADNNVEILDHLILQAEKEMDNKDLLNNIFRYMHTLKGSAGIVNAVHIQEIAHRMESILHVFREKNLSFNTSVISLLFEVLDMMKDFLDSLRKEKCIKNDISSICQKLDSFDDYPTPEEKHHSLEPLPEPLKTSFHPLLDITTLTEEQTQQLQKAMKNNFDCYLIGITIAQKVQFKSLKTSIIEERLKKNGIIIALRPKQNIIDACFNEQLHVGIIYCSNMTFDGIKKLFSLDGVELQTMEVDNKTLRQRDNRDEEQTPAVDQKTSPASQAPECTMTPGEEPTSPREETTDFIQSASHPLDSKEKSPAVDISTIKIDSRKLDKLMNLSGELVIIRARYARLANLLNGETLNHRDILQTASKIQEKFNLLNKKISSSPILQAVDSHDAFSIEKILCEVKNHIEKLYTTITKNEWIENLRDLNETTSNLQKISSDIQSSVMQSRMIPIEGVFTRFKRIVRDISKDLNKEVRLEIFGSETELDKKIVDSLGDPLTHMIRNAVDHGLEDTPTRMAQGKNAEGTITLKASHRGNNVCIEISDDGKGIDSSNLVESAHKKGLLTSAQTDRMTENEKLNIMFMPGFSTAEKVTGLSGRGVGMDVVRNIITSLNGTIEISTEVGKGSTFILKIPLTLAIIQALLVTIGSEIYAFPLDSVIEIIKIMPSDIYSVDGNTTVKLRNHALSLINLENIIHIQNPENKENVDAKGKNVIVITDGETKLGVSVDSLMGKDEIVIKPFTEHFSNVKGITGASILADGNLAIILDPAMIIKESK